jgi:hypothetical protein
MQVSDLNWTKAWLFTTIWDYYGVAFSLSAIAISTEDIPYGFLWTLGFCLLGSPVACAYIVMRLLFKTISLKDHETIKRENSASE